MKIFEINYFVQINIYFIKTDINGLITNVGNHNNGNEIRFELNQNYPNPFNPSTTISWQSPVGSHQTIKVFDILGNEIATLVDEYKPAGRYEVEFLAALGSRSLATGIYFYQLKSGEFIRTKKMIYIK